MLFGGIRRDLNPDDDCLYHPYLEIADPTDRTCSTTLELDKYVLQHASRYITPNLRLRSGAGLEQGPFDEKEGMPFVSDAARGIICAEVYWPTLDTQGIRLSVFVLDIEGLFSKLPSPSDLKQRHVRWEDVSPSVAVFSYGSQQIFLHGQLPKYSYVAGFRCASPTQLLDSNNPRGPRCFFVYDFNPHREAPGPPTPEDPDPETGHRRKSASEITQETVGGLSCWKMRFDLPPARGGLEQRQVALMDGGVVLFEVRCLTIFSEWFVGDTRSSKDVPTIRARYGFLDLVICRRCAYARILEKWLK